jgi:hypothetical protein
MPWANIPSTSKYTKFDVIRLGMVEPAMLARKDTVSRDSIRHAGTVDKEAPA